MRECIMVEAYDAFRRYVVESYYYLHLLASLRMCIGNTEGGQGEKWEGRKQDGRRKRRRKRVPSRRNATDCGIDCRPSTVCHDPSRDDPL